ncbi:endonuclease G, mitochondrial isoform X3 [Sebastes fasciatus]|uniref:endonuclease G, mitochondrial isoform X3 n=1 Tax=Sebastes fasciatus TaxID=394691 RepID=UPI003D9E4F33
MRIWSWSWIRTRTRSWTRTWTRYRSWCRTGASWLVGVGVGASLSSLMRTSGGEERDSTLLRTLPVLPVPGVQAATELTVSPGGSGALMKYGFPSLANIKTRESYVTSYDPRTRTASWRAPVPPGHQRRLQGEWLRQRSSGSCSQSQVESESHAGHLLPEQRGTTEPSPEPEHLEQSGESVSLSDQTLPERLRLHRTALPAQVLILEQLDGRGVELRSYVLPNEPIDEQLPLERFLVPIETIERASGLLFVPNIMKRSSSLQAITNR